jgi:hypothetical protein
MMNMAQYLMRFVMVVFGLTSQPLYALQETLPPLGNSIAPQTFEALWAGYDPRAEPLDLEILKAWEEER